MVSKLFVKIQELFQGVIIDLSLKILFHCDLVALCRHSGIDSEVKVIKMAVCLH